MEILNQIPDVVWGAGLGSLITLFGVWLTNRHERIIRKEEREHVTKKEIFLKAAEEITLAKVLLMKIPNMEPSQLETEMDVAIELAKIHVVGNNETIQAVTDLHFFLGKSLFSILPQTMPLNDLRTSINILSNFIDSNSQKQNQILNEMTAFNLRGDNDKDFWNRLQKNFEYHSNEFKNSNEERDKKYAELAQLQKELLLNCVEISLEMSNYEVEAIRCMRTELELEFDIEEYKNNLLIRNKDMEAEFSKFLVKIPNNS